MEFYEIIGIIAVVLCGAMLLAALYYRSRGSVVELVSRLIALAEATGLPGPEKMQQVVDGMYQYLPAPFRAILTREQLAKIAQDIFDWTRQYAVEYLESKKKRTRRETIGDDTDHGNE